MHIAVSVWLEYVQFSIGNIGDTWAESGLEAVRQTFERAITAVGIHVTQGCLIWEAYREFETAYLQFLKVNDIDFHLELMQIIFKSKVKQFR